MEQPIGKIPEEMRAVIMAGGRGTRLLPYTTVLPKPLMPLHDHPIMEHVLEMLRASGVRHVVVSVGHLAELIQTFFGDGSKWDLSIEYAIEDVPLNTMGALSLMEDLGEDFFVVMGDILTDLDLRALYADHVASDALMTVATFKREVQVDFGVLEYDADRRLVEKFTEKPVLPYDVSMGIYVLNRRCRDYIPKDTAFGFDHLVHALLEAGKPIRAYPHTGKWLDIGRREDYERANEDPRP